MGFLHDFSFVAHNKPVPFALNLCQPAKHAICGALPCCIYARGYDFRLPPI